MEKLISHIYKDFNKLIFDAENTNNAHVPGKMGIILHDTPKKLTFCIFYVHVKMDGWGLTSVAIVFQ